MHKIRFGKVLRRSLNKRRVYHEHPLVNGKRVGIVHFKCYATILDPLGIGNVVLASENHRWDRDATHHPRGICQPRFESASDDVRHFPYAINHLPIDRFVLLHQQSRNGKQGDAFRHCQRNKAGTLSAQPDQTGHFRLRQLDRNFRNTGDSGFDVAHLQTTLDRCDDRVDDE